MTMLSSSTRQATASISILVAVLVLAAGCLVFLSLRDSASPALLDPSLRRLGARHNHNDKSWADPKTTQLVVRESGVHPPDIAVDPLWKDIGYDLEWSCGREKCFFHSVSDPKKGYLISIARRHPPPALNSFEYAQELESEFGIRHFLTGVAYPRLAPEYFVEHLNESVNVKFERHWAFRGLKEGMGLVIQENVVAPQGSMLFKCVHNSKAHLEIFDSIIERGEGGWAQKLVQGMSVTKDLLDRHPDMATDFQIMFDLSGQVYQLDFDRPIASRQSMKAGSALSAKKLCLDEAIAYISVNSINES